MTQRLTPTQWLICIIASIGFAFDIYELLMLPLIIKPALFSLGGLVAGTPEYKEWARILFFVPAIAGGAFGLFGGWLTDRLGRRRVLTWSILLYAFGACAAGFATSLTQLLIFRCCVFVGVCVEFVAAVAWLAELFPDKKQKEKVLGFTQAFSSFGGLLVALMNTWAISLAANEGLPAIHGKFEAWRYTLISGLIPAIPLILIRPFLPESPAWQARRAAGNLRRPSIKELFSPGLLRITVTTTALFACCYGIAFGAIQHLPQIVPGFADVQAQTAPVIKEAKEKAVAAATAAGKPAPDAKALQPVANKAKAPIEEKAAASVQTWQEVGGLIGRVLLAFGAIYIVNRRGLLRLFQVPALIFIPGLFFWIASSMGGAGSLDALKWGVFLAGVLLVGQFSFWGNYIPKVFPLHLRGTGESFAANIGGRVLGTSMAWVFFSMSDASPPNPAKMAQTGAWIALAMAALGLLLSFFMVEPSHEEHPE
jgi:MFS family permease